MKEYKEGAVQSVDRSLIILEELARHKDGCGVTTLANVLGLHKSTTHRLLMSLFNRGYVKQDLETNNYCLGTKILFLAGALLESMDLRSIARPYIQELANQTQEIVHLAVLEGEESVYIDKVESKRANTIRIYSQIGKRVPLHCTGVGKVLLCDMDFDKVKKLVKEEDMTYYTPNTITNHRDFEIELKKIKEQGYGFDEIEHEEGIRCIAAPVYDRHDKVIASISIAGPTLYITKERFPELIEKITNTAKMISYQLGNFN
ncbi:MAG: IclR family transcriptional regulator [Firmicutes bacterium HGW-Firmicutes-2]|jgi:DNA-binding IclR family transcriptional regulator|nr:MAG: IclR family transcriptional regulator [Firmicutes bacterium HGW-Firmicutes-2]